jgi:hypothetical protein
MEQEQQRKSYVLLNVSHSLDRPLLKAVDETTPQEMLCSGASSLAMMQLFEQCDMLRRL